jgi:iron complex outermembrane receptor protein
VALVVGGIALPGAAFAQDAKAQDGSAVQPAPGPAADAGDATADIVVTATRREQRLQDVPAAISVASGAQLDRLHIASVSDLTTITPGLTFSTAAYIPEPTIRGIGSRGVGVGDEGTVPIYVDGVYQSFPGAANLQFNNIERVEVLKGPQGALYGRNSLGGAINVVTERPGAGFTGRASLSYGRFDDKLGKLYVAGGSDVLAASLAVVADDQDGYIRDIVSGRDYGRSQSIAILSKIAFTPTTRLKFDLSLSYSKSLNNAASPYEPVNGNTIAKRFNPTATQASGRYEASLTLDPLIRLRQYGAALHTSYDADFANIVLINSYQDNRLITLGDTDGSIVDVNHSYSKFIGHTNYNELYATSNGSSKLQWLVGGTYYNDLSGSRPLNSATKSLTTGNFGIANFVGTLRTSAYATYGQLTYHFSDLFQVIAGGRYTSERKDVTVLSGTTTIVSVANGTTFNKFVPSVTLQLTPSRNLNLYAKYSEGFKSGLFNANATTGAAAQPIQPETLKQYEAGIKARISPVFRIEASGYYGNYDGIQANRFDPASNLAQLANAGDARIYGFELAGAFDLGRLTLSGNIAWQHARYRDAPAVQVYLPTVIGGVAVGGNTGSFADISGKTVIKTPALTAGTQAEYRIPVSAGDLRLTGNVSYTGRSYWDVTNRLSQKPYVLVDGAIAFDPKVGGFTVSLWARNLLNSYYDRAVVASLSGDFRVPAEPRTYGIEIGYKW